MSGDLILRTCFFAKQISSNFFEYYAYDIQKMLHYIIE